MAYAEAVASATAQHNLAEVLFQAYFTDGVFLSADNICELAGSVEGLSSKGAREALENKSLVAAVGKEAAYFSNAGIRGVPFFFINGKPAFSGAQPPEVIFAALKSIAEEASSKVANGRKDDSS